MKDNKKVRKWLRDIRNYKKYSQETVANLANITSPYYSMIEGNVRSPSIKVAKEIAEVLDFDWTKFFEN